MSYVIAAPEMMTAAATDLAGIGSALSEVHTAAAAPTVGLVPAAADEVSTGIAHLFSQYASGFQALAGKAAAFHDGFVHTLKSGASSYTSTEAASTSFLQPIINAIGSLLNKLPEPFTGIGTLFEQQPIQFIIGTLVFLPLEVLALIIFWPLLLLGAILAGA